MGPEAPEPDRDGRLRASDADREAVAARLQTAHAEGRITAEELAERLDATYAARTMGDLAPLTADLPVQPRPLARRTSPSVPVAGSGTGGAVRPAADPQGLLRRQWAGWAATSLLLTVIWGISSVMSGSLVPFWPVWVIGIWGAVLLGRSLFGRTDT